jgi:hypothetical protein
VVAVVDVGQEPLLQQVLTDRAAQAVVAKVEHKAGTPVLQTQEVPVAALVLRDRVQLTTDSAVMVPQV